MSNPEDQAFFLSHIENRRPGSVIGPSDRVYGAQMKHKQTSLRSKASMNSKVLRRIQLNLSIKHQTNFQLAFEAPVV
jgi:hypothetical protein